MATITRESFGRHADRVEENRGEFTLPVGEDLDIHPGAKGGWAVVSVRTGGVLAHFADIDKAVAYAESR